MLYFFYKSLFITSVLNFYDIYIFLYNDYYIVNIIFLSNYCNIINKNTILFIYIYILRVLLLNNYFFFIYTCKLNQKNI